MASAPSSPHLALVMSILSLTMCLQAPSIIPVAMGQPLARAVAFLKVAGALAGAGTLGRGVAVGGGAAADPGRDLAGLAVQDLAGLVSDPFLGCRLSLVVEGPGGPPQAFGHVDEVDDDRDGEGAAARRG